MRDQPVVAGLFAYTMSQVQICACGQLRLTGDGCSIIIKEKITGEKVS